ncbi:hypothetical protein [Celeribacter marinus]|uniref:Uncharacterized protein n=1 Tax=Celeribacter marinus TaxID=1397108 RepID=A0A0N9ZK35_9RHOB|nr:hypothetical protein [Celeribacter marinus]ALI56035.1 hypothetical protein IMCC12053_2088 [Celeribacter marinus]SFK95175.1 hypothetical protein SAMN05444421_11184 [Celeribacter marinus]
MYGLKALGYATVFSAMAFGAAAQGLHGDGAARGHGHGANGMGHDEVNMPGLRGENVTEAESLEMQVMFQNFTTLSRTVDNLSNGIRTVTTSSDPEVLVALTSHVAGMINRVETRDNPLVFIQSPTLDIFFERGDEITTEIEVTDAGIVVTQTADDPDLIEALHTHAAEVSDMASRGMMSVHERMMGQ